MSFFYVWLLKSAWKKTTGKYFGKLMLPVFCICFCLCWLSKWVIIETVRVILWNLLINAAKTTHENILNIFSAFLKEKVRCLTIMSKGQQILTQLTQLTIWRGQIFDSCQKWLDWNEMRSRVSFVLFHERRGLLGAGH